jgi:drug/metabolite transporter (DMT)-like permease
MAWFALSLVAAFTQATSDALLKRDFSHLGPFRMGALRLAYALPWFVAALPFVEIPRIDHRFCTTVACALPIEVAALACYMKAIQVSPLSLVMPLLAFTPAFLVLTGRLVLGEKLGMTSMAGVALIVAGSYCLNITQIRQGVMEPIKAVARDRGARLMLLTAVLYSMTSALGKRAILYSSPAFFGITYYACLALIMLAISPFTPSSAHEERVGKPAAGLAVGMLYAAMVFSHTAAISMTQAAVMIALKRTSMLFGVFYGAVLFRETRIKERLLGAIIMLSGVLVLGFRG